MDLSIYDSFDTGEPTFLFGTFSAYPFAIMMGMLCAILTVAFFWKKEKYQWDILLTLIIITIPSALIGARLFYIFERLIYSPADPFPGSSWYAIWEGGLSIQGGVIIPTLLNLLYLSRKKNVVEIRKVFGIILPTVLIGQAIGRWGNFANHEVYGAITNYESLAWMGDAIALNMYIDGSFRIPLFFWESLASLVGYVVIVWGVLYFGWTKPGTTGGLYLIWYGLVRTVMEPFRAESYAFYTILSILSIVGGILLVGWFEWTGIKRFNKIKIKKLEFDYINKYQKVAVVNVNKRWINE